ncbi:MAG: hypothetical protein HC824_17075 [Synechococcales cyanobacterium RM1_1_8]|nr:hypothetical protein [Synechococcales cyanobacterium RM1_1_8]
MKQHLHWFWIGLLSLGLLLCANRSLAQDNFPTLNNSHLDGKVANLEINLRQLQRDVGQLRSQSQISRPSPSPPAPAAPLPPGQPSSPDPQFQNLATLVIELRQDLRNLEARITQLEAGSG